MVRIIVKSQAFAYWRGQISKHGVGLYADATAMAEDAAEYFKVSTDEGRSDREVALFDYALEFTK